MARFHDVNYHIGLYGARSFFVGFFDENIIFYLCILAVYICFCVCCDKDYVLFITLFD